jgi:hypothetical protein
LVATEKTFEEAPKEVECPIELAYLWGYFKELNRRRPRNGMGITPLTHEAITAWSDGMDIGITPFERACIVAIDDAFLEHVDSKKD